MKKKDVHDMLLSYLAQFSYCSELLAELLAIISGSGFEERFFTQFSKQMRILSILGKQAYTMEEFERINEDIYSMHFSSKYYNIRILYGFLPNDVPVLLLAFYERAGKKRSDYTLQLPEAANRLSVKREEFSYEQ